MRGVDGVKYQVDTENVSNWGKREKKGQLSI